MKVLEKRKRAFLERKKKDGSPLDSEEKSEEVHEEAQQRQARQPRGDRARGDAPNLSAEAAPAFLIWVASGGVAVGGGAAT